MPFDKLADDLGSLSLRGRTFLEYIFLGGTALDLRCKTKVLGRSITQLAEVPWTTVDGLQTGQASPNGSSSVVYLKPRALFRDPFRAKAGADAWIVLCDTFSPPCPRAVPHRFGTGSGLFDSEPAAAGATEWEAHLSNNRAFCEMVMQQAAYCDPWFSCEQQYTLLDADTQMPLGSEDNLCGSGSGSYCKLGAVLSRGREFAEAHMLACLHAGIKITGMHALSPPGRWCYDLGVLQGLDFADQLWASRYILLKVAEKQGVEASLEPQAGDGGPAVLLRYSTRDTREGGWQAIQQHMQRLEATHTQHMLVYGTGNSQRALCPGSAAALGRFSAALESTAAAVSVPQSVMMQGKGHYEDRRPAGNMDPYLVSLMLVCTTCSIPLPTKPSASPPQQQQGETWRQQSLLEEPAASTASSSISAKPSGVQQRQPGQQYREKLPQNAQRGMPVPVPAPRDTSRPFATGGRTSSSIILDALDAEAQAQHIFERQQQLQQLAGQYHEFDQYQQQQQQLKKRPLNLMPDTPDQDLGLLGGAGGTVKGGTAMLEGGALGLGLSQRPGIQ